MQSEVMDCHVADAPRNDEANSRHCEAEGRGNPRSPGGMDCRVAEAPRNDGHFRNDESNSRHCEAPESGPLPHTDLEPDPVTASVARQSMQSEVMDCHVADAPRNDGHFRNDESNSRHCEAEGRGNPRSQKSWIAT
ncbi:MAG: hypothetical protein WA012_01620, partial [Rhodoferax sp.]|uniref:hypothetical protein n=1 Tax=Rhodoferax sp. TaxID=50421 RepID=UPI003BB51414